MTAMKSLVAAEAPIFPPGLDIPSPYAERMAGLERRALSIPFGLSGFGVFQTRIPAGEISGLHHRHTRRDEFIYVVSGQLVLVGDDGETVLGAGMCAGFPAGGAHHLENRSDAEVIYLDIGSGAVPGDEIEFPDDDLKLAPPVAGQRQGFTRRNGDPL
ncbi:MAG: cupin [Caulobacter sp.]|nr:cupin [Caulobacter sp.]